MKLRVATFNLRNGLATDGWNSWLPFRWRSATAAARQLDADILGFQEAYGFQARGLRRRLGHYGMIGDGRSARRTGERCSILYRKDRVHLVDSSTRWYGDEPFRPGSMLPRATHARIATLADLEVDGRRFTVANTHLDQRYEDNRSASVRQLLGWLGDGPTIVVGDLNAKPGSEPIQLLEDAGLRSVLPPEAPGTNHDFGNRETWSRIDHILVSHHWQIGPAEVVTEKPFGHFPSDHWPVVADLDLPGG